MCELDLVFNFYKVLHLASRFSFHLGVMIMSVWASRTDELGQVYAILDEVFLAGEIEETSKQVVLARLEHLDKLD